MVVIFDLDGTLTRPMLDFDHIRAEIGVTGTLLEALEGLDAAQRARAEAVIERHEARAAAHSDLQPGARETLAALRQRGWKIALMTRNSRASVAEFKKRHHIDFDFVRTREDGVVKPSPQPVFDICRALAARPAEAWVVGDFHFDVLSGRDAGARTVLFVEPDRPAPPWAGDADVVISRLDELLGLLPARAPANSP